MPWWWKRDNICDLQDRLKFAVYYYANEENTKKYRLQALSSMSNSHLESPSIYGCPRLT